MTRREVVKIAILSDGLADSRMFRHTASRTCYMSPRRMCTSSKMYAVKRSGITFDGAFASAAAAFAAGSAARGLAVAVAGDRSRFSSLKLAISDRKKVV